MRRSNDCEVKLKARIKMQTTIKNKNNDNWDTPYLSANDVGKSLQLKRIV